MSAIAPIQEMWIGPDHDLAFAFRQMAPGGRLHLAPGLYSIIDDGTTNVFNCDILGAGQSTVIQRNADEAYSKNNQPVILGKGDNLCVRDVVLDCNAPTDKVSDFAYAGLRIEGKNAHIDNVHVIHASGSLATSQECWPIFIVNDNEIYPTTIISNSTVSDSRGNYVEGFSATGAFVCRNCRVEHRIVTDDSAILNGFQGAGRSMFINCVQSGGTGFFYTDTSNVSCIFRGCLGMSLMSAIIVNVKPGQVSDGLTVDGCEFQLVPNLPRSRWGIAINGLGAIRNVRVLNSVVRWTPTSDAIPATPLQKCAVAVTGTDGGTIIQNNMIDMDFSFNVNSQIVTGIGTTFVARAPQAPIP